MKRKEVIIVLLFSLVISGVIALFASSLPDGLERVAIDQRFDSKEAPPVFNALFPGYAVGNIASVKLAACAAGIIGTLLAFVLAYLLADRLKNRSV